MKNSGRMADTRSAAAIADRNALPVMASPLSMSPIPTCLLPVAAGPEAEFRELSAETPRFTLTFVERDSLYGEFQPLVRRLVRQYGDSNEAREDLTGEIYYRFCRLLDCFDPSRGIPLKPYLVRQLSASIYTYARHQWRRQKREIAMELESGLIDLHYAEDPSRQWDEKLTLGHVRQGLPDALMQLSLRQRQVVVWRYYESRSFEEIAERLGIQTATARSILRHGLTNIRHKLIRANYCYE